MEKPLVSVLLPVFNSARTLADAIQSIVSQTYSRWELLILDDGSTDDSLAVAHSFSDPRIRVLEGRRLGLAAELNRAVELSNGDYCARMDADDLAYPHRLQRQLDFLEQNPVVDLVCSSVSVFRSDGRLLGVRRARETHDEICARPWRSIPMAHPTWMGRSQWFRSNPYLVEARGMEDRELLTRAFPVSCFAGIPDILLAYRENSIVLRKQLMARRQTFRHITRIPGKRPRLARYMLGAAQIGRFALEIAACTTGLQYRILRNRATPPTNEERREFEIVWSHAATSSLHTLSSEQ